MKKTLVALLLVLLMVAAPITCLAADASDLHTADALNELGLFLGTGKGYELDKGLTRAQGTTLLVRMIGMEETAENGVYETRFTDVPNWNWAFYYIGYAYENGITNGTGPTTFSPNKSMTDYMFLTLVLRALGYSDQGEEPMFTWDQPYALAQELKLIEKAERDTDFTRADAISIFWNAMDVEIYDSDVTLAERLIGQEIFTAAELAKARDIQKNGRKESTGVPTGPDSTPAPAPDPTPEPTPDPAPEPSPEPTPGPSDNDNVGDFTSGENEGGLA